MVGSSAPVSIQILAQRLRRQPGIDAGRAEKHQLLGLADMGRVDHVGGDRQIVIEEFAAQLSLAAMPPTPARPPEKHLRAIGGRPSVHRRLVAQIDLTARHSHELDVFLREPARQGGSNHPAMTGDEDALALQLKRGSCRWQSRLAIERSSTSFPSRVAQTESSASSPVFREPCWHRRSAGQPRSGGNRWDRCGGRSCRFPVDAGLLGAPRAIRFRGRLP